MRFEIVREPAGRATAALVLAAMALSACSGEGSQAGAAQEGEVVTIGAAWPLSGAFEFNGTATLQGARAAIEDVNEGGGIASLDGAMLELAEVDVGQEPEDATAAMERLLRSNPVAVAGSWQSSLSLAASEVTERARVPYITEAFADDVTGRGFEFVFDYAPPASEIRNLLLEAAQDSLTRDGVELERVALVGDNSAAAVPLQDGLLEEFEAEGIEVAVRDRWTTPLQDASNLAQSVARADVDAVFMIAFGFNDVSTLATQMRARGVDVPIIQNGGQALIPEWRTVGDEVKGMTSFVITHALAQGEQIAADLAERVDEPFVWQDQLDGYFAILLIAEALEAAASVDPEDVRDALASLELDEGPAVDLMPTKTIRFGEDGRIEPAFGVLAQWQEVDGELMPCTVYPEEYATCDAEW